MSRKARSVIYIVFVGAFFCYALLSAFSATYLLAEVEIPAGLKAIVLSSLFLLVLSLGLLLIEYGMMIWKSRGHRDSIQTVLSLLFLLVGSGIAVTWYFFNEKQFFGASENNGTRTGSDAGQPKLQ